MSLQCRIASGRASEYLSLCGSERANVLPAHADHVPIMTERLDAAWHKITAPFVDGAPPARLFKVSSNAIFDISQGPLGKKDRQYLGFTAVDIESAAGATYSLELAFREPNRGSIDRNGEDSAKDGEELSRKQHDVG